jgi:hypothetical protein
MYVTQPPCKALGIYLDYVSSGGVMRFVRIGRAANHTGVKIGQLLETLQDSAVDSISRWRYLIRRNRRKIAKRPWTEYTFDQEREAMWEHLSAPPTPKFIIVLESLQGNERNLADALWLNTGWRSVASEWEHAFERWEETHAGFSA